MPDKVLICPKKDDARSLQSLYSNLKMNQFFGRDLVQHDKDAQKKKLTETRPMPPRGPLHRKIFYEIDSADMPSLKEF